MKYLTELEDYQQRAVVKLSKLKVGALYMEQGTGKTRTGMELAITRYEAGKVDRIFWLCPCNVKGDIRAEFIKHIGYVPKYITICGIETLSTSVKWNCALLSYAKSHNVFTVVDESSLIKNGCTLRSKNINRIGEDSQYRLILNGTPLSKSEADLFSQWYFLDWRILGYKSFSTFARNHIQWTDIPGKIDCIINIDYLMRKIAPYTFQITKDEAFHIPVKWYSEYSYDMGMRQEHHYAYIAEYFINRIDEMKPQTIYRMFSALDAVISGLFVDVSDPEHFYTYPMFENPHDNPRINELLDIIPKDEKTVIFCKRVHEVESIISVLTEKYGAGSAVKFTGRISSKQRTKNKELFRGSAQFLVANKACGAFGLNLQFCHNVIFYSNDWDYATRIQAEDRVHRKGQAEKVRIIDIVASRTLDERIVKCLARKENLLDSFKRNIKDRQKLEEWIHGKKIS